MIMEKDKDNLTSLETVFNNTVQTLDNGKNQLFIVAENARSEYARVSRAVLDIDKQLGEIYRELRMMENSEAEFQSRMDNINVNFGSHTEEEIKTAYEEIKKLQIRITQLKERQNQLEHKKNELETSLTNLRENAEKAEDMVSHIGLVMDFVRGNLKDLNVKLESLHQKQQMGLQIIKAQEEERKRVAREIHDGPAQSMANVVLRMEFCEKLMEVDPEKVKGELRELKDIVRGNLQDVRKIIFDLRPMALDDLGVMPALKRYIEDFRQKNDIDIEMSFYGKETRLDPVLEIAVFRLVQEALNNVIKHAHAARVEVSLEMMPEWVQVRVADDGVGFLYQRVISDICGNRFGLINMKERIDLLGGEIQIETAPQQGTKILFKVPVEG